MSLEATPMQYNRFVTMAVLFLLLATTLPAFAQKGDEDNRGGGEKSQKSEPQHAQKAQPQRAAKAAPQHAQKTQPQRAAKAQPQRAEKAQPQRAQAQQPTRQRTQTVASNRGGGQYGRISNANYTSHFGHGHSFHMGRPEMIGGYNRFQYGGYRFGYNQGWPVGWGYNDNVYVVYEGGGYYMYDLMHPGIHISLSIF